MLVLSRVKDERILIGDDVSILVIDVKGKKVRLGIEAPKHLRIDREEICQRIDRPGPPAQPGDAP
jgi:carbon storage regulator